MAAIKICRYCRAEIIWIDREYGRSTPFTIPEDYNPFGDDPITLIRHNCSQRARALAIWAKEKEQKAEAQRQWEERQMAWAEASRKAREEDEMLAIECIKLSCSMCGAEAGMPCRNMNDIRRKKEVINEVKNPHRPRISAARKQFRDTGTVIMVVPPPPMPF